MKYELKYQHILNKDMNFVTPEGRKICAIKEGTVVAQSNNSEPYSHYISKTEDGVNLLIPSSYISVKKI